MDFHFLMLFVVLALYQIISNHTRMVCDEVGKGIAEEQNKQSAEQQPLPADAELCKNRFCVNDFFRMVANVVHGSDPCELILCFQALVEAIFLW